MKRIVRPGSLLGKRRKPSWQREPEARALPLPAERETDTYKDLVVLLCEGEDPGEDVCKV